jgi:general transcriptional corepressor TUP1
LLQVQTPNYLLHLLRVRTLPLLLPPPPWLQVWDRDLPPLHGASPGYETGDTSQPGATSSFPEEFNVHNIPPEFKKEGNDWFAIFNPKVKRVLDVTLAHTLMHERCVRVLSREWPGMIKLFSSVSDSVVCCVRFSADGKYLATGCNRTTQIYDTKTGQKTWLSISAILFP